MPMTCEEYRSCFGRTTDGTTRAERAVFAAHALGCQSCLDATVKYVAERFGRLGLMMALVAPPSQEVRADFADPEFCEVLANSGPKRGDS